MNNWRQSKGDRQQQLEICRRLLAREDGKLKMWLYLPTSKKEIGGKPVPSAAVGRTKNPNFNLNQEPFQSRSSKSFQVYGLQKH